MEDAKDETEHEMSEQDSKLPLHVDIMQLARLGEIGPVQKLFQDGKFDAQYKDHEGITPLHWAAINNHLGLCKFLIDSGADVNTKGGESVATPAMWAVQKCHTYVVHLLLQRGADPSLTDVQGYNMLHLATFDGNVFLVLLLLHQSIPIDEPDPSGHTSLMWAAYKGYPAVVELLLQWGASVTVTDAKGFTALHWALVKGNGFCIRKLIEAGSDRFAETEDGKTPAVVAQEMKSLGQWRKSLVDLGFGTDGTARQLPSPYLAFLKSRDFHKRSFFLAPFLLILVVLTVLSKMVIYAAIPFAVFITYCTQYGLQQLLLWAPSDMKDIQQTPYLAGIFAGSLFWVLTRSITTILKHTYSSYLLFTLIFIVCASLCTYFYAISMIENPGFVPKLSSRTSQKAVVDELISQWKYNEHNFCVHCMIRTPARSKHCRRCNRCTAKHDHHCPWIFNCVGANNQRHFFLYVATMWVGVMAWLRLVVAYIGDLPSTGNRSCNILSDDLCEHFHRDPFTVVLACWISIQMVWVTMLLVTQIFLIARGQTTWESMRGNTHHMSQPTEAIAAAVTAGSTTLEGAGLAGGMPPTASVIPAQMPRVREGRLSKLKKIFGVDTFMNTASGRAAKKGNPFSRGVVTNCRDFWCDPAPYMRMRENGSAMLDGQVVNYTMIYEPPPRIKSRSGAVGQEGGVYQSVGDDENV